MDKFEKSMIGFQKLSSKEQQTSMIEGMNLCICPDCPTYNECAKNAMEGLFCAHGTSFHCISHEIDCICPSCPITEQYGLTRNFFCTRGAEAAQRLAAWVLTQK